MDMLYVIVDFLPVGIGPRTLIQEEYISISISISMASLDRDVCSFVRSSWVVK